MLNWDKGNEAENSVNPNYIEHMQKEMDDICEMLTQESKPFSAKDFFDKIFDYVKNNDRLLYTNITNYIFTLNDETFGILQTNIDNVVNYMYGEDKDFVNRDKDRDYRIVLRTKRTILKMWDHINLARRQYVLFNAKNDQYEKIVDEKLGTASAKITKDMSGQLISLVSIFTALSFLLFGGISSLDNILDGAKDIPILKLLLIGSIWCLCIMNLIFVFMFFVAKLTGLEIRSTDDVNANAIQKYPYIWWCNWVLCSACIIFSWIYYLKRRQLFCILEEKLMYNSEMFVFVITALIVLVIIFVAIYILEQVVDYNKK